MGDQVNGAAPLMRWFCRCDKCLAQRPWEAFGMAPPPPEIVKKDPTK